MKKGVILVLAVLAVILLSYGVSAVGQECNYTSQCGLCEVCSLSTGTCHYQPRGQDYKNECPSVEPILSGRGLCDIVRQRNCGPTCEIPGMCNGAGGCVNEICNNNIDDNTVWGTDEFCGQEGDFCDGRVPESCGPGLMCNGAKCSGMGNWGGECIRINCGSQCGRLDTSLPREDGGIGKCVPTDTSSCYSCLCSDTYCYLRTDITNHPSCTECVNGELEGPGECEVCNGLGEIVLDETCAAAAEEKVKRDREKYSGAFVVSDTDWRRVLELMPAAVWNPSYSITSRSWCNLVKLENGNEKCIYPFLIYSTGLNFDFENHKELIEETKLNGERIKHVYFYEEDEDISNSISRAEKHVIGSPGLRSVLEFWNSYDKIVYVEDNYELALQASQFASYQGIPLIIKGSEIDNSDNYKNRHVVCITLSGSCFENVANNALSVEEYNLEEIIVYNAMYARSGNVLINPRDREASYCETRGYCGMSLEASHLAFTTDSLIRSVHNNPGPGKYEFNSEGAVLAMVEQRAGNIAQDVKEELDENPISGGYILAGPKAIPTGNEELGLVLNGDNIGTGYLGIDRYYIGKSTRIYDETISDVSFNSNIGFFPLKNDCPAGCITVTSIFGEEKCEPVLNKGLTGFFSMIFTPQQCSDNPSLLPSWIEPETQDLVPVYLGDSPGYVSYLVNTIQNYETGEYSSNILLAGAAAAVAGMSLPVGFVPGLQYAYKLGEDAISYVIVPMKKTNPKGVMDAEELEYFYSMNPVTGLYNENFYNVNARAITRYLRGPIVSGNPPSSSSGNPSVPLPAPNPLTLGAIQFNDAERAAAVAHYYNVMNRIRYGMIAALESIYSIDSNLYTNEIATLGFSPEFAAILPDVNQALVKLRTEQKKPINIEWGDGKQGIDFLAEVTYDTLVSINDIEAEIDKEIAEGVSENDESIEDKKNSIEVLKASFPWLKGDEFNLGVILSIVSSSRGCVDRTNCGPEVRAKPAVKKAVFDQLYSNQQGLIRFLQDAEEAVKCIHGYIPGSCDVRAVLEKTGPVRLPRLEEESPFNSPLARKYIHANLMFDKDDDYMGLVAIRDNVESQANNFMITSALTFGTMGFGIASSGLTVTRTIAGAKATSTIIPAIGSSATAARGSFAAVEAFGLAMFAADSAYNTKLAFEATDVCNEYMFNKEAGQEGFEIQIGEKGKEFNINIGPETVMSYKACTIAVAMAGASVLAMAPAFVQKLAGIGKFADTVDAAESGSLAVRKAAIRDAVDEAVILESGGVGNRIVSSGIKDLDTAHSFVIANGMKAKSPATKNFGDFSSRVVEVTDASDSTGWGWIKFLKKREIKFFIGEGDFDNGVYVSGSKSIIVDVSSLDHIDDILLRLAEQEISTHEIGHALIEYYAKGQKGFLFYKGYDGNIAYYNYLGDSEGLSQFISSLVRIKRLSAIPELRNLFKITSRGGKLTEETVNKIIKELSIADAKLGGSKSIVKSYGKLSAESLEAIKMSKVEGNVARILSSESKKIVDFDSSVAGFSFEYDPVISAMEIKIFPGKGRSLTIFTGKLESIDVIREAVKKYTEQGVPLEQAFTKVDFERILELENIENELKAASVFNSKFYKYLDELDRLKADFSNSVRAGADSKEILNKYQTLVKKYLSVFDGMDPLTREVKNVRNAGRILLPKIFRGDPLLNIADFSIYEVPPPIPLTPVGGAQ